MKNLKIEKPIISFDLETTGVDVAKDRIVQYSFIKIMPDGTEEKKTALVNPGIPIPEGASAVHGIYDKDVKDAKMFSMIAPYILPWIDKSIMAGYNIINFDIPLLATEFERVGISDHGLYEMDMIDAMVLYGEYRPRTLVAATKDVCGKDISDSAHDAEIDTLATIDVIDGLSDLMELDVAGMLLKSKPEDMVDFAKKLKYDDDGEVIYNIGKDRGSRVKDNPGFARWMLGKDFPPQTKKIINELLKN